MGKAAVRGIEYLEFSNLIQAYLILYLVFRWTQGSIKAVLEMIHLKLIFHFFYLVIIWNFGIGFKPAKDFKYDVSGSMSQFVLSTYCPFTGNNDTKILFEDFQLCHLLETINIYFKNIGFLEYSIPRYPITWYNSWFNLRIVDCMNFALFGTILLLYPQKEITISAIHYGLRIVNFGEVDLPNSNYSNVVLAPYIRLKNCAFYIMGILKRLIKKEAEDLQMEDVNECCMCGNQCSDNMETEVNFGTNHQTVYDQKTWRQSLIEAIFDNTITWALGVFFKFALIPFLLVYEIGLQSLYLWRYVKEEYYKNGPKFFFDAIATIFGFISNLIVNTSLAIMYFIVTTSLTIMCLMDAILCPLFYFDRNIIIGLIGITRLYFYPFRIVKDVFCLTCHLSKEIIFGLVPLVMQAFYSILSRILSPFYMKIRVFFQEIKYLRVSFKRRQKASKARLKEIEPELDWFFHCCLYGHTDQLKKILQIHSAEIDINKEVLEGYTALHLAAFGNHVSIIQILQAKFGKELNYLLKNSEDMTPLDLAIQRNSLSSIKILLQKSKIELATLSHAIKYERYEVVPKIADHLKKQLKSQLDLKVWLERFVEVGKEFDHKKTTQERKNICKSNLEVYKSQICIRLSEMCNHVDNQQTENQEKSISEKEMTSLLSEFECPVCFELMTEPRKIYSCSQDHWICSLCLSDHKMLACPQCREDFKEKTPSRRLRSERMLSRYISLKKDS